MKMALVFFYLIFLSQQVFSVEISSDIKKSIAEFSQYLPNAQKTPENLTKVSQEFCRMTIVALHFGAEKKKKGSGNPEMNKVAKKACDYKIDRMALNLMRKASAQEATIRSAHFGCNLGAHKWLSHEGTNNKLLTKVKKMPESQRKEAIADASEILSVKICPDLLRAVLVKEKK